MDNQKIPFDPSIPVYASFSGGKDSVATWLYLERDLGLNVTCVFADTGFESDLTYNYIRSLQDYHGLPLARVQPLVKHIWEKDPPKRIPEERWDEPIDMVEMIKIKKGRPPTPASRFCTTILKLRPIREYFQSIEHDLVMATGVRADESRKRAKLLTWEFDEFMGRLLWLPIHRWSAEEVFAIHDKYKVPPNPLYKKGCSRVGCFPCINHNKGDIAVVAKDEDARRRLIELEERTGHTFFTPKKVAQAYRSKIDPKSGKPYATAEDVFRWALSQQPQFKEGTLFENEEPLPLDYGDDIESACSSIYGLCE